jgi:hypothetical protein
VYFVRLLAHSMKEKLMPKRQRGNKEPKKPKKDRSVVVPASQSATVPTPAPVRFKPK